MSSNKIARGAFFSGLSGLQLPVPKYQFPAPHQDSSRLTYYSTFFNSIEINSSFYKLPLETTVRKWAASVPENFNFTFKFPKQVTHDQALIFEKNDVEPFLKVADKAGSKKGCLLIQLPPSMGKEKIVELDKLLYTVKESDQGNSWNIAVEFRNKSWYQETTYHLLDSYQCAIVIHDIIKSATPFIDSPSKTIYLRFHGPTGDYRGSYTEDFLHEYAGHILDWQKEGKVVYVYFNNTMGSAFRNLLQLTDFLALQS